MPSVDKTFNKFEFSHFVRVFSDFSIGHVCLETKLAERKGIGWERAA